MRKAFAIIAVSFAVLSQTAFAQADNAENSKTSMFLQGGVGFVNNYVEGKMEPAYRGKVHAESFAGTVDLNVGVDVWRRVDVYVGASVALGAGETLTDRDVGEEDQDYASFNIHIGAMAFPFSQNSILKGAFAGLEFGLDWYQVETPKHIYYDDEKRFDLGLKVGNVWSFSHSIDLGIDAFVQYHTYPFDDSSFLRTSLREMRGYSIGFNAFVMYR